MQTQQATIRQATVHDLDQLVPLFDAYREFCRQPSDPEQARRFLRNRFEHYQSTIFLAFDGSAPVGFTQLYPSFSSVAMARIFILSELFVAPAARGRGVGSALLEAAARYGRGVGARCLVLVTEKTNATAQSVYEKMGWVRDDAFFTYELAL